MTVDMPPCFFEITEAPKKYREARWVQPFTIGWMVSLVSLPNRSKSYSPQARPLA